jgi:hypothetical protein
MYVAHAVNARTGRGATRKFASAELAAQNLLILLRADGWTEDAADTISRLVAGSNLTHKGFNYRVTQEQ